MKIAVERLRVAVVRRVVRPTPVACAPYVPIRPRINVTTAPQEDAPTTGLRTTARPRAPPSAIFAAALLVVIRAMAPDMVRQTQAPLVKARHTCTGVIAVSIVEASMGAAKSLSPSVERPPSCTPARSSTSALLAIASCTAIDARPSPLVPLISRVSVVFACVVVVSGALDRVVGLAVGLDIVRLGPVVSLTTVAAKTGEKAVGGPTAGVLGAFDTLVLRSQVARLGLCRLGLEGETGTAALCSVPSLPNVPVSDVVPGGHAAQGLRPPVFSGPQADTGPSRPQIIICRSSWSRKGRPNEVARQAEVAIAVAKALRPDTTSLVPAPPLAVAGPAAVDSPLIGVVTDAATQPIYAGLAVSGPVSARPSPAIAALGSTSGEGAAARPLPIAA